VETGKFRGLAENLRSAERLHLTMHWTISANGLAD